MKKKRTIKFRFWCPAGKAFIQDYKYNGLVDELFDEKDFDTLVPQQFTGLIDKNGKEIYEGDLINFSCDYTVDLSDRDVIDYKNCEVYYDEEYAGFFFGKDGHQMLDKIIPETLEVIGNTNLRNDILDETLLRRKK
ncbi:MAG: YopX family protein [Methylophilaceae bacterium]